MPKQAHTVLLIDDDEDLRLLMREVLEPEGLTVFEARDGRHALSLLELAKPELIITDLMMPVMDGFSFLDAYRTAQDRVPVLAVSSYDVYLKQAVASGATAALGKPFTEKELLAAVQTLLESRPAAPPEKHRSHSTEAQRLAAVLELRLESLVPTAALRSFVERTARIFDVPICQVSIVDGQHQYAHASCGVLEGPEGAVARELAFCTHAVFNRAALVVQDSFNNPFFKHNALVREQGFRFYAGVPLITRLGVAVGTFCLMDFKEHPFNHFDLDLLAALSRRVLAEFDEHEHASRPHEPNSTFPHLSEWDTELNILGRDLFTDVITVESSRCLEQKKPLALLVVLSPQRSIEKRVRVLERSFPRAHLGRLGSARIGLAIPGMNIAQAKKIVQAQLGASDFLAASELSSLMSPGVAEAVLSALEAPLRGAGLETAHPPQAGQTG